jgi:dTDP-4-amino-4,6-dideoxygalactose transaminase
LNTLVNGDNVIIYKDSLLEKTISAISYYDFEEKYVNKYWGLNSRLDKIQANEVVVKLKHLNIENEKNRKIAKKTSI